MEALEDHIDDNEDLSAAECNAMMKTGDLIIVKLPDAQWLLNTIGALNAAHPIFERGYVAPKPIVDRHQFEYFFPNQDDFFNDLPPLSERQMKSRKLVLPRAAQLRQKIMIVEQQRLQ